MSVGIRTSGCPEWFGCGHSLALSGRLVALIVGMLDARGHCRQLRALLFLPLCRLWAALCSGVRVKQRFLIPQGLCRARPGSERGLDGEEPLTSLARSPINLAKPKAGRLPPPAGTPVPAPGTPEPPAALEVGCDRGHRPSGQRVSATPGSPGSVPSSPPVQPPSVPPARAAARSVWGFLERELVGMQTFLFGLVLAHGRGVGIPLECWQGEFSTGILALGHGEGDAVSSARVWSTGG